MNIKTLLTSIKKKKYLIIWGGYFWGYNVVIIKAKNKDIAKAKFMDKFAKENINFDHFQIKEIKYGEKVKFNG